MKKIPVLIVVMALLVAASCSKKTSEIVKSIPDHAALVASLHPEQIYKKGEIGSMESITESISNEFFRNLVKDPLESGIDMSEYLYFFAYFIGDEIVLGMTADLNNQEKFTGMIEELNKKKYEEIIAHKGYSMLIPESSDGGIAWNDKQVILLLTPQSAMTTDDWQTELVTLFEQDREQSINSVVNFRDFAGKMKDMNMWLASDDLKKILEKTKSLKEMEFDLPVSLDNNYSQVFVEFADGAMMVNSEMHLSDDIKKATETFLLAKQNLNKDLLKMSPGNDLLMALAFSMETDRVVKLMKNFNPPQMEGMSDQVEKATGVPGKDILEALNGDFVLAINGAQDGASVPVEVLIGIGLDDESLQEKMMGSVGSMAQVEKEGDFFMIKAGGVELYSGIVEGIWVITNVPGYKDAITGKGLEKTLTDSKFKDYTGGSMGMYMNLDLTTYPASMQNMMAGGGAPKTLELLTESFDYLGMEASNYENKMILKTANDEENSLYTLLRLVESFKNAN
jgi:hypothetical protein